MRPPATKAPLQDPNHLSSESVGNGLCAVPEGMDDGNGTTHRSWPMDCIGTVIALSVSLCSTALPEGEPRALPR